MCRVQGSPYSPTLYIVEVAAKIKKPLKCDYSLSLPFRNSSVHYCGTGAPWSIGSGTQAISYEKLVLSKASSHSQLLLLQKSFYILLFWIFFYYFCWFICIYKIGISKLLLTILAVYKRWKMRLIHMPRLVIGSSTNTWNKPWFSLIDILIERLSTLLHSDPIQQQLVDQCPDVLLGNVRSDATQS